LKLHALLVEGHVLPDLAGRTRDDVLREMVTRLDGRKAVPEGTDVLSLLLAREKLGTTAIGCGVAIPHCKISGIKNPVLFLGLSRPGVSFEALDGKPSHAVFLVVAPVDNPNINLRILAAIAKLVRRSGALTARLLKALTEEEILQVLREEEKAHA